MKTPSEKGVFLFYILLKDKMNNRIYIILEFIVGLVFSLIGLFIFSEMAKSFSLSTSILYGYIVAFISGFLGVILVGYFHFKKTKKLNYFGKAIGLCFIWFFLFAGLYLITLALIPQLPGILSIIFPLAGAVFGFNSEKSASSIPN
ncbi:MAG TPA: hypothetical protein VGQ04_19985 [Chitinophagaceae bacterium]|nr:hypothetical protein [Chitinophagaceae bacterium]